MLCELANIPLVERLKQEDLQRIFGLGGVGRLYIFAGCFGPLLGEGKVAVDQIPIGLCAPRVGTAGDAYMGAMLRLLYLPAKASNRFLEGSRVLEPSFINGIEVEPSIVLRAKPLLKRFCASDVKGVLEVTFYILDSDKERRAPLLFDILCPPHHLECLAGTCFRQDNRAILLVEGLPSGGGTKSKEFLDLSFVRIAWRCCDRGESANKRHRVVGLHPSSLHFLPIGAPTPMWERCNYRIVARGDATLPASSWMLLNAVAAILDN